MGNLHYYVYNQQTIKYMLATLEVIKQKLDV